jgi:2'-5' RNA ligase
MVALVPSEEDIARLAVAGGESPDELHVTLSYLGDAADLSDEARDDIADAVEALAEQLGALEVDGFAISMFNPTGPEPCIVLGLSGPGLDEAHDAVTAAVADADMDLPAQHAPWIPHITLVYTDDPAKVAELVDRAGPVRLDRLRLAFAGEVTDYPLGGATASPAREDEG